MYSKYVDRIIVESKRAIARLPNRLRIIIAVVVFVLFWFLLLDTPPIEPERSRRRPLKSKPVKSLPGGDWQSFRQIFAFGDSWSTTQFSTSGGQPNEQNPFGNPELPKNGTTGPPNWLHFLTLSYNASFLRTYIIAEGAATIDRDVVPPHENLAWTHPLKEQINDVFEPNYNSQTSRATWDPKYTLFAFWFGVVDLALLIDRKEQHGAMVNIHNLASYANSINKLYELGARHFLILTAPPMYISPSGREEGHDPKAERLLILDFNNRIYEVRKQLQAKHSDATYYVFDVHGLLIEAMQNPESVVGTENLRNTTENCWKYNPDAYQDPHPWDWYEPECGVPFDQYFWANPLHPTQAAHNATAAAIVEDCMGEYRTNWCS